MHYFSIKIHKVYILIKIFLFVVLVILHYGFEGRTLVLTVLHKVQDS